MSLYLPFPELAGLGGDLRVCAGCGATYHPLVAFDGPPLPCPHGPAAAVGLGDVIAELDWETHPEREEAMRRHELDAQGIDRRTTGRWTHRMP